VKQAVRSIRGSIRKAQKRCALYVSAMFTLVVRTRKPMWRRIAFAGTPEWDERNRIFASFVPSGSSVLDIGCGAQTLRRHLTVGCKYQPCDLIKSSPDVIVCDFNAGNYPAIQDQFDFVICSGVLEYIRNPPEFLNRVSSYGRSVLLSYNPLLPEASKIPRLARGWVNHFRQDELLDLFSNLDLESSVLCWRADTEVLFLLRQR
jgi:hypothetical protein